VLRGTCDPADSGPPDGLGRRRHARAIQNDSLWSTFVYNPSINIGDGVRAIQQRRQETIASFPGCSERDYTLMALRDRWATGRGERKSPDESKQGFTRQSPRALGG
jgi:hypothetical protein